MKCACIIYLWHLLPQKFSPNPLEFIKSENEKKKKKKKKKKEFTKNKNGGYHASI